MRLRRRELLGLSAGLIGLAGSNRLARAQSYPTRAVRLIVPARAGGAPDTAGRLIAQWLSERLGQSFVVENIPGAAGNTGTAAALHAAADGYTLLLASAPNTINVTLYDHPGFDFVRDVAPIASLVRVPQIMEINPAVPIRSVPDFIAFAKKNPVQFASSGVGSGIHLAGVLFNMRASLDMQHVPYRDSEQALAAVMAGDAQVMFDPLPSSIDLVRSGKLRGLAVTTAIRSEVLPDLPSVSEFVPGYAAGGWLGIGAPAGTPSEIVDRLNREINAALADAGMKARLAVLGGAALPGSAAEFSAFITQEVGKWAQVVKISGIKPGRAE
jgi:tripartite-type tricarboxylate transporter receptor subunit TctC